MRYKRPLAIAAIIFILLLYVSTIVFALIDHPLAESFLMTALFCTIVVPAILYGYYVILNYLKKKK